MNKIRKRIIFLLSAVVALSQGSCSDQWDDDDVSGFRSQTLWEVISSRADLKEFASVLRQNGDDALLQSSGTYTVFAPTNEAMQALDADQRATVSAAHIALLEYNKAALDTMSYLTMYNTKLVYLPDLGLTEDEIVCRNGVLRFATHGFGRQPNIFERLSELADEYDMAAFILSQGDSVMDMMQSVQIGLDETNNPIYDTVMVYYNPLFDVVPLNNNDSLLTLVLLDNETFAALTAKYWPYLRQHVDISQDATLGDPQNTMVNKVDSAATDLRASTEVVYDMTCYPAQSQWGSGAAAGKRYYSTRGIAISLDSATMVQQVSASNGSIQILSNVGIRLRDNKICDVYVEAEDYYRQTNSSQPGYYPVENYTMKRVNPNARGGFDVLVCGADTLRQYWAYYVDSLGNMTDSIIFKKPTGNISSSTNELLCASGNAEITNRTRGGSILGLKAQLFACNYRIFMRSVDDIPSHCKPDYASIDYQYSQNTGRAITYTGPTTLALDSFSVNRNYPIGGVHRQIQKVYISQPGDAPLRYNNDPQVGDFVLNAYPNNPYSTRQKFYTCLAPIDPAAITLNSRGRGVYDAVGLTYFFGRLGINAGYGVDDPNVDGQRFEMPLLWCSAATRANLDATDGSQVFYSGVLDVYSNELETYNVRTGAPANVPNYMFQCGFEGEATVFVTSATFNTNNTSTPTANARQPHGSIMLDYLRFEPIIEE